LLRIIERSVVEKAVEIVIVLRLLVDIAYIYCRYSISTQGKLFNESRFPNDPCRCPVYGANGFHSHCALLPPLQVEKMTEEAKLNAAEDKKRREAVETKNQLDSTIYQLEKTLKDAGDKLQADKKSSIEGAIADAKKDLESNDGRPHEGRHGEAPASRS